MPNHETALSYLLQDPVFHMNMIEVIRRKSAHIIDACEDGVLLYDKISAAHMISTNNPSIALHFLGQIEKATLFVAHQNFCLEEIENRFKLKKSMECYQAVLSDKQCLRMPKTPFSYKLLSLAQLDEVCSMYSIDLGSDYLKNRILHQDMYGAFDGDILVGFIGLHAEGSMGMLEVKEAYRFKKVASSLVIYLSNILLQQDKTPFSQLKISNTASRKLNEKLGFTISDKTLFWLE